MSTEYASLDERCPLRGISPFRGGPSPCDVRHIDTDGKGADVVWDRHVGDKRGNTRDELT
jgi:hypothetical protein